MKTKIEWTEYTWNPIIGCSKCSPGCQNCYAEKWAYRLAMMGNENYFEAMRYKGAISPVWMNRTVLVKSALEKPLHLKRPRMIFVCSMGDLFHESVPFEWIAEVFDTMCAWRWPNKKEEREGDESQLVDPGHTYQILTKRPERIPIFLDWFDEYWPGDSPFNVVLEVEGKIPKHIWLGVTAENQETADQRIPILLDIPAAIRFVSIEPCLEEVDLTHIKWAKIDTSRWKFKVDKCWSLNNVLISRSADKLNPAKVGLDWVIVGPETGVKARPCKIEWIESIVEQCRAAQVPCFVKKVPIDGNKRYWSQMNLWPPHLRIREYPKELSC